MGKKAPEEKSREKPSRTDEARQFVAEYANDLREILDCASASSVSVGSPSSDRASFNGLQLTKRPGLR